MRYLRILFRPGLPSNIGSHGFAQLIQLALQLVFVPLFAHHWGLENYGVWLVLFTIPGYLSSADLGFARVATNDLIVAVARGDRDQAIAIYRTVLLAIAGLSTGVVIAAAIVLQLLFPHAMGFAHYATQGNGNLVAMLLVGYGLSILLCQGVMSGFQAIGLYGPSGYVFQLVVLAEGLAALGLTFAGWGMVAIAAAYLAFRFGGTLFMAIWLRREAPWLFGEGRLLTRADLLRMARPTLSTVVLPIAYALTMQGHVLVIGAFAGTQNVPAFAAVRTMTRLGVQITNIVSLASMPGFTVAQATGEEGRKADLVTVSIATAMAFLLPTFVFLVLFGQPLVQLWSGGALHATLALVAIMAAVMVLDGLWHPAANLLLSINEQARYSWFFLLMSALALGLAIPLVELWQATGAAIALLALNAAMLAWVLRQSRLAGIVERHAFRDAPGRLVAMVRERATSRWGTD